MLSRLEHVPIATAVRLPSTARRADRAGARRGRRRGHHRHGRVGRAGRRSGGRDAVRAAAGCAASGRCGPASGIDAAALESRASVYAMVETAQGLAAVDEICCRAGTCPASTSVPPIWRSRWVTASPMRGRIRRCSTRWRRSQSTAAAAGLVDRRPRRRRGDRKHRRADGLSDDHAGVGVAGAAHGRGRAPRRGEGDRAAADLRPTTGDTTERHRSDRVALVTGAARGQGAAIVARLLADGFRVAACDLLVDELTATAVSRVRRRRGGDPARTSPPPSSGRTRSPRRSTGSAR